MFGEKLVIISTLLIIDASGSALHGHCSTNEQCGTLDTYCKNGTCVCTESFAVIYDTCVPHASPGIACTHKKQCQETMGPKSICRKDTQSQCVCKSFHHLHKNQCIKSKWLDEMCEHDYQCYCGQSCEGSIECAKHMCTCKPGFKKVSRRCIPDPTAEVKLLSIDNFYNSVDLSACSKTLLMAVLCFVRIL